MDSSTTAARKRPCCSGGSFGRPNGTFKPIPGSCTAVDGDESGRPSRRPRGAAGEWSIWTIENKRSCSGGKANSTSSLETHALGYHRVAKRMVMLDGVVGKPGILVRDANGWRAVEANPLHPRHQCSALAWNPDLGGLLMHGGEARQKRPRFDATLLLRMPFGS